MRRFEPLFEICRSDFETHIFGGGSLSDRETGLTFAINPTPKTDVTARTAFGGRCPSCGHKHLWARGHTDVETVWRGTGRRGGLSLHGSSIHAGRESRHGRAAAQQPFVSTPQPHPLVETEAQAEALQTLCAWAGGHTIPPHSVLALNVFPIQHIHHGSAAFEQQSGWRLQAQSHCSGTVKLTRRACHQAHEISMHSDHTGLEGEGWREPSLTVVVDSM
jgi:hypothetical protein